VGTTAMVLVAKNCCTDKAMCTSALPWWMNQSWYHHFSGCFRCTCSLKHC
jgi:hypothetical protein